MRELETDVVVVGSGFGAAAPALRLGQAGVRVLMVEKGPDIVPHRDFRQTQDPAYLKRYLKVMEARTIDFTYAEGLGGGSGFYEMVSLRAPKKSFEQTSRAGRRYWPEGITRAHLDPYYDRAEKMLGVTQVPKDRIPKSGVAFAKLMRNLGYTCDRARYAVRGCVGSGYCVTGCIFGAKHSLHFNYLPEAQQAGVETITGLEAVLLRPLGRGPGPSRGHRYELWCRRGIDPADVRIRARAVVLGGGTVGTAKLLLCSRSELAQLSPHVGKNIAFNGSVKAGGILPEGFIEGDMVTGMSNPGMISYEFWESRGITIAAVKPSPLQLLVTARISLENEAREPVDWGVPHVDLMKLYRRRMIVLDALGLTPPAAELGLAGNGKVSPHLEIDEGLRRYHAETLDILHSILRRNGCRMIRGRAIDLDGREYEGLHFGTTHMVGSCRMADRCEDGVIDRNGEVFHYPGVFVTDGSAIPTSLGVNPSLTILANAERCADHMVRTLRSN